MDYAIDKLTYADGRAYRYNILDEEGQLCYVAERTGMLLPSSTYLVEFFDPDRVLSGRLQPPELVPWRRASRYEVFVSGRRREPYVVIRQQWRLVDILLLRLPRYEIQLGELYYVARGSRYGRRFYEIFHPPGGDEATGRDVEEVAGAARKGRKGLGSGEVKVGEIRRSEAGPSYVVEVSAVPLRDALLVLAALVILIDMEMYS